MCIFCTGAALVLLAIYLYSVPCNEQIYSSLDQEYAEPGVLSAAISSVQAKVRVRRRLRACCLGSIVLIFAGSLAVSIKVESAGQQ